MTDSVADGHTMAWFGVSSEMVHSRSNATAGGPRVFLSVIEGEDRMRFCHACGHRLEIVGKFCSFCGAQQLLPGSEAASPATSSGPLNQEFSAPANQWVQPPAQRVEPEPFVVSPQVGPQPSVPPSTVSLTSLLTGPVVRDLAAALLLALALGLTWDFSGSGGENTWVLLTVLLSLLGIGATYVLRPSVIGRTVPVDQISVLRLTAVVPLLLVILVTMVRGLTAQGGIGIAVAVAAAAVVLAGQHDAGRLSGGPIPWARISGGLYLGVGAWVVIAVVTVTREVLGSLWGWSIVAPILATGVIFVVVGLRVLRRMASEWAGGLIVAGSLLIAALFISDALNETGGYVASRVSADPTVGGMMTLTLMAAAASLGPGVYRSLVPQMVGETRWVQAVIGLLGLVSILALSIFLQLLFFLIETQRSGLARMDVKVVLAVVLAGLSVAALILCRQRLVADPAAGRRLTVWVMVGLFLAAVVLDAASTSALTTYVLTVHFVVPVVTIGFLTIPPDVRRAFGPMLPATKSSPTV